MIQTVRKLLSLFDKKEKPRLFFIFLLMVFGAFLEAMSISVIVPVVSVMLKTDSDHPNRYYLWARQVLHIQSEHSFIIAGLLSLLFLIIFKTVYLLFEYKLQYRFVYNSRFSLQKKLLHSLFCRPYEYYLNTETGKILHVLQGDIIHTYDMLLKLLRLATELTVSITLTVTVFIISPLITTCVALALLITVLLITKLMKPKQKREGLQRNTLSSQMNKWLLQSVSGIREIKIGKKELFFEDNYLYHCEQAVTIDQDQAFLKNSPKFMLEMVSMCTMLAVMTVMIIQGKAQDSLIPELSAFAMAAVKLLPSANNIANSVNQIIFGTASLEKVLENLKYLEQIPENELHPEEKPAIFPFTRSIEFSNVSYHYQQSDTDILTDASFTIPYGECIGIVGPSGAGKTTVIDILVGLLEPYRGSVLLDGIDIRTNYSGWREHIGYIPQMIFLMDDSIRANVAFGFNREAQNETQVWTALEEAHLADFVRNLPKGLDTQIGERGVRLSGGQRQRIGIARALYNNPDVLIFDEATSALDIKTEQAIMDSIYGLKGNRTIIIITHRISALDRCDRIFEVKDKKIRQCGWPSGKPIGYNGGENNR